MSDRGMKKWAPYKSLVEQTPSLEGTYEDNRKIERPKISQDVAEEINEILVNYHNQDLKIRFFKRGCVYETISSLKKIDVLNKKIVTSDDVTIAFIDLLYLENY